MANRALEKHIKKTKVATVHGIIKYFFSYFKNGPCFESHSAIESFRYLLLKMINYRAAISKICYKDWGNRKGIKFIQFFSMLYKHTDILSDLLNMVLSACLVWKVMRSGANIYSISLLTILMQFLNFFNNIYTYACINLILFI